LVDLWGETDDQDLLFGGGQGEGVGQAGQREGGAVLQTGLPAPGDLRARRPLASLARLLFRESRRRAQEVLDLGFGDVHPAEEVLVRATELAPGRDLAPDQEVEVRELGGDELP